MKTFKCIKRFELPTNYPNHFIVLDFETTGLSPIFDDIIQIGAILYKHGKPVATFEQNINPQRELPVKITELTGITEDDIQDAPLISDVLPKLIDFIDHYPIVAHNATFDINVLNKNLADFDLPLIENTVIDTFQLAKTYAPFVVENYKLETLKQAMNIDLASHNAINDCLVAGQLYLECRSVIQLISQ